MRKFTTAQRLNSLMEERNLKQIDIIEKSKPFQKMMDVKLNKSSLSQYVNGTQAPDSDKLALLGFTLGVSEAWLMGYDVAMERPANNIHTNQGIVGDNTGTVNITNNTDTSDVEEAQAVALATQKEILDVQTVSGGTVTEMLEVQKEILSYQKKIYNFLTNKPTPDNTISEELYEYNVIHRLSAGTGSDIPMDYLDYDVVYHDKKIDYDLASYITGNSMEPTYFDGEIALIKKTGFDYDGGVYAVVWDGQTYIKKVYREDDGLRLVSLNNKYRDKFAPFEEEPVVIGLVVGHFMPHNV